jgi:DNA-binding transcriptional ArsR family regulator
LALVTVLQFGGNLTDRAAAHRVRFGMDVKYALGMELDDPGFDASVLSEFRARLVEHSLEERALDLLLTALKDKGLVKAGGRQRTDSTRVLAAVRDLNRLELAGETLRAALESLACAVPDWLAEAVPIRQWTQRYGPRIDSWQLPSSKAQRTELALAYGRDGSRSWKRCMPRTHRCGCGNSRGAGPAGGVAAVLQAHGHRDGAGGEVAGERGSPAEQTATDLAL